ncbi:cell envelope integrity protein CreD [Asticcacaulis sp. 201]|uniref:cell envelope integrity protein CreD n=1 Tax=Asticcacaulis sp. 201 TaxID=3028787 RepID=UPI0029161ECE|nr:cell envelope integrity protein CreD [Asticcacaulis sp. 201]MDV6331564.1 cell envelope integrity protein CreD [Asticcacaulis sp. 201]
MISRSKGAKLLIVCVLAVLMSVPAGFVFLLLLDRTHRAEEVTREIGDKVGGPQTFLGPVITVPYAGGPRLDTTTTGSKSPIQTGTLVVFPIVGNAIATSKSEVRSRSLFRVPVYATDLHFTARFDLSRVVAPAGATLDWSRAQLVSGASDSRGARKDIIATVDGQSLTLAPAPEGAQNMTTDGGNGSLDLFSTPLTIDPARPHDVTLDMSFTGAQKLGVLAYAKSSEVTLSGDWNTPSFGGGFLPASRAFHHDSQTPVMKGEEDLKSGFRATWSVPFIARGLPAVISLDSLASLGKSELSVAFVENTNPYQNVARSLKYALLFVGLVFLTYFVFESTSKRDFHPAQYILVGLAQITFYLLLLSLSERIGFDYAFLTAAAATVTLISSYAGMVFKSRLRGFAALIIFSLLYGMIYTLMRMEDYALLIGAVAAFVVIAAVMILTRNINWYGKEPETA